MTTSRQKIRSTQAEVEQWLDELEPVAAPAHDATPHRQIVEASQALANAETALRTAVSAARFAGYSWAMIGASLGVSRQAAQQRFGHDDERASPKALAGSGGHILSSTGDEIGGIGQIYLDDSTGDPAWITVRTGLIGTNESFVPLEGAEVHGDDVLVGYDSATIAGAPTVHPDGSLSPAEEDQLYDYYGLSTGPVGGAHCRDDQPATSLRQRQNADDELSPPSVA